MGEGPGWRGISTTCQSGYTWTASTGASKDYELRIALKPDPRLLLGDLPPNERAALEAQTYAPTALGQVAELMQDLPVTVPRW